MAEIKVEYDGGYPNLCRGKLIVVVDGKEWRFPEYCMNSGGSVTFDEDWNESISEGPWAISEWPENFPEDLKGAVEEAINLEVDYGCCGCCGGCV